MNPRIGRYEVCTTTGSIDATVADLVGHRFGSAVSLEPLEALGDAGLYDRFAVSKLYGGKRVQVVRGWREVGGEFESITLLSPYPDASLTRLEPGTMIIRWTTRRERILRQAQDERSW